MTTKLLILLVAISALSSEHIKHIRYPKVGLPFPDCQFQDVENFSKRSVDTKDYRGKWLLLDCWNQYCDGCVKSFPRIDSMANFFHGNAQFLLIGYTGTKYTNRQPDDSAIRVMFDTVQRNHNLSLPVAFDSTFFNTNDLSGCPYIIVIDPKGIVRAVTNHITTAQLQELMMGGNPKLDHAFRQHEAGSPYLEYINEHKRKGHS